MVPKANTLPTDRNDSEASLPNARRATGENKRKARSQTETDSVMALRTPGVAKALNISERSAQRLIATKALPSFRLGRMRLVRRSAIEQFMLAREQAAIES
jgi:excisionase family DNA binding protein